MMCTAVMSSGVTPPVLLFLSLAPFSASEAPLGGAAAAAVDAEADPEPATVAAVLWWCCVSFDSLIVVPVVLCSS